MNKLEVYSDLSFNFDTDFESMLMESMIDDAMCEAREAHMALESYLEKKNGGSFDDALESLMAVLEGKDEDCCDDEECDDDDCKKKKKDSDEDDEDEDEDAEEAYLRSVCEAADASLGQKIAAAWKAFKEKVGAFLNRIAQSLKNVVTNFGAKIAKSKAKNDIKITGRTVKFMEKIGEYTSILNGVTGEDVDEQIQKMKEYSKKADESALAHNGNEFVTVQANTVKTWMGQVSNMLRVFSKALSALDKHVNGLIRSGSPDARATFASSREVLTDAMQMARQSVSYITQAVGNANKDARASKKGAKGAADNEQPIEKVEAEIVDNK